MQDWCWLTAMVMSDFILVKQVVNHKAKLSLPCSHIPAHTFSFGRWDGWWKDAWQRPSLHLLTEQGSSSECWQHSARTTPSSCCRLTRATPPLSWTLRNTRARSTKSYRYLQYHSNHHARIKTGIISCFHYRAQNVCSEATIAAAPTYKKLLRLTDTQLG